MTDTEKIKRIEELLNDLDLADMSRNELWRELKSLSFDEIEEEMWHWYCFISDISNVVNMRGERNEPN